MTLRVGYVNIQGFANDKLSAIYSAVGKGACFDYLFLAETWHIAAAARQRHELFVATTPLEDRGHDIKGRPKGGIVLLAHPAAHGLIDLDKMVITEYSITISVQSRIVSAIYLPPSMDSMTVESTLRRISLSSTVIIGDVNVRFRNCRHQHGQPGPPDRLGIFMSALLNTRRFVHMAPDMAPWRKGLALLDELTSDHCFVRSTSESQSRLQLVSTASLKIRTDHTYVMVLTLFRQGHRRETARPVVTTETSNDLSIRYRINKLHDLECHKMILRRLPKELAILTGALALPRLAYAKQGQVDSWQAARAKLDSWLLTVSPTDVDSLNSGVVSICQRLSQKCLGKISPRSRSHQGEANPTPEHPRNRPSETMINTPTTEASVYLYKKAVANSRENDIVLPTKLAQLAGSSALDENYQRLRMQYTGMKKLQRPVISGLSDDDHIPLFTNEEVALEIKKQSANKSCGSDGIHIRLIKVLASETASPFTILLTRLYNLCLQSGRTPLAWNHTEIHLLMKDLQRPKDADNLRPITLICIIRKIFERLLLSRFDTSTGGWATLHPCQAGFRRGYSAYSNAAVVHHVLSQRHRLSCKFIVFLDFKSAFDVLDHSQLLHILQERGCPTRMLLLLSSLMFWDVKSRVIVNGELSPWMERTSGVLQGSPLSPHLFNIYIDGLLGLLNKASEGLSYPRCLFYADDGVIMARNSDEVQQSLHVLTAWTAQSGILPNISKCGYISEDSIVELYLCGQLLPRVQSYNYLGFPVCLDGIDFAAHLETRISKAIGRTKYLSNFSDSWGISHRLRVYNQYLAPMFEYGFPLVFAWMSQNKANEAAFTKATSGFGKLLAWISHTKIRRHNVIANLCGLVPLKYRCRQLHTSYQLARTAASPQASPLQQLICSTLAPQRFLYQLGCSIDWDIFTKKGDFTPTIQKALRKFLQAIRRSTVEKQAQRAQVTRIIPFSTRIVPGLAFADITLRANPKHQGVLFQYRVGGFLLGRACPCSENMPSSVSKAKIQFHRGHETCSYLPQIHPLTEVERVQKARIRARLQVEDILFTDLDFLLSTGKEDRVFETLSATQKSVKDFFALRRQNSKDKEPAGDFSTRD